MFVFFTDCSYYSTFCTTQVVAMVMIVILVHFVVVFIYYAHKKSLLSQCYNRIKGISTLCLPMRLKCYFVDDNGYQCF